MTYRLPHTPYTPVATATHYFDDIFARNIKPTYTPRRVLRRSSTSTAGSLGLGLCSRRGSIDTVSTAVSGDGATTGTGIASDSSDAGTGPGREVSRVISRVNSVGLDGELERDTVGTGGEFDVHLGHHINEQAQRHRPGAESPYNEDEI